MTWRIDLGNQIREARIAAGLSQLQLAERTSVKREHISNLELGKNSPAVKIVTEIANALGVSFMIDGCTISPDRDPVNEVGPVSVPRQLGLDFGAEYQFQSARLHLKSHPEDGIEINAIFLHGRRRA